MRRLYDPEDLDESGGMCLEGRYHFKVKTCDEAETRHRDPYFKIKCEVVAEGEDGSEKRIEVYQNIFFGNKSLWKVKEFYECVGLDFEKDTSVTPKDILGLTGIASYIFGKENDKGRKYLEVHMYVARKKGEKPVRIVDEEPETSEDEDVPF